MKTAEELGEEGMDFPVAHRRSPGVPTRFEPAYFGKPDALMRSLARRGLIWIERRQAAHWRPFTGWRDVREWLGDRERTIWLFGLTVMGQSVANQVIKQKIGE